MPMKHISDGDYRRHEMSKQDQIRQATAYASIIIECERREDYGGSYDQAWRDFADAACATYRDGKPVYYTSTGRIAKLSTALKSYGVKQ